MKEPSLFKSNKIGILGGGQLGKMLSLSASKLGYKTHVFAENPDDPAVFVTNNSIIGNFHDTEKLHAFASEVDMAIIEFENIPINTINLLSEKIPVYPGKYAVYVAQNRVREKEHIRNLGITVADFVVLPNVTKETIYSAVDSIGYPSILKTAELGYDGKCQYVLRNNSDIEEKFPLLDCKNTHILEKMIDIKEELSVIVGVDYEKSCKFFPIAQNRHIDGILHESAVPAEISDNMRKQVQDIASCIALSLGIIGILAVEFFLTTEGELLVNEIAPRPHNSGHWSIDACNVSQFEQLIRAACGLPLRDVQLLMPCIMRNILNDNDLENSTYIESRNSISMYGKSPRPKRKMGHVNILGY